LLGKLLKRINWLRLLGLAAKGGVALATGGLAAHSLAGGAAAAATAFAPEAAAKLLNEDAAQDLRRGIREFRADFEKLLAELDIKALVVMIDDLDRCMPDTIIETLEAIKLFLFVPRSAFVIGADERLVKYAVRRRFPELPGERAEVGRDYLEKLIQFPVRVPGLGRPEMETYINLLFAKNGGLTPGQFDSLRAAAIEKSEAGALHEVRLNLGIAQHVLGSVPEKLADNLGLAQRIAPLLAAGLNGNPRQCKRFLNALVMRVEMAKTRKVELKQRVLAKLMLLEYFKPESFKKLAELQAEQGGKPAELAAAERPSKPSGKEPPSASTPPPARSGGDAARRAPPRPAPSPGESDDAPENVEALPVWLADPWIMNEWLRLEPALAQEDLRPYFFFSRDILGSLGGSVQRMSPRAQEIIADLLQASEAVRRNALGKAGDLSAADGAAVFEALGERARQEDDLGNAGSAFARLCDWVDVRRDLFGQFLTFLTGLPDASLPISIVPKLEKMVGGDGDRRRQVKAVLTKWEQGTSTHLKNAAKARLPKL
ncbi:MAG TPA: P-loop NTPase fold protein, partial [Polyangiaceae bacterium]